MAEWEEITSGLAYGGYVAWEAAVDAAMGKAGRAWVPVFVKLVPTKGQSLLQAIEATQALPGLRQSRHERDLLATERALVAAGGSQEVRLVAFWPRDQLDRFPEFWRVLRVGQALAIAEDLENAEGVNLATLEGKLDPAVPLVGVIDDGIAFLNTRFRKSRHETRIRAIWLQASERGATTGDVLCGRVLDGDEIDALLRQDDEERSLYREINRSLFQPTDTLQSDRHAAHGTHVLDLAAGAAPWAADPVARLPILAVQLPPGSIRETSGRRMETSLVQGLRWLLAEVLRQAHYSNVPPVVVNVSLGSLAGPGDRHAFVADWLAFEAERHSRITGSEIRIVVAYGNARLSRLSARGDVRQKQPMELIWRVQPDDHTSSFLELRVEQSQAAGLELNIIPPSGSGLPSRRVPWPATGQGWRLSGPIAMVSASHEDGGQSHVLVALGPTADGATMPATPSGAWRVEVHTTIIEPVRVTARVQRDDTPPGYPTLGRQSWLDHPMAWDWDEELRGYVAPRRVEDAPGCPVTREGTCVAYAGAMDRRILFVGAGRPVIGDPEHLQATTYSAEGVQHFPRPDESLGPTLMARGDAGILQSGLPASGVMSGSVVRMSGTSVAAPQVTRALARYFLSLPASDQMAETGQMSEAEQQAEAERKSRAERMFLTGKAQWGEIHPREGHATLTA